MSLLERVREIGADEAQIEETTAAAAWGVLMRDIRRGARAPRRLRRWGGIGVGGLVAGAAVTAIVVGSVLAPPVTPETTAAAATVLHEAADATRYAAASDPVPGQYLRIEEVTEQLVTDAGNGVPRDPSADAGFVERTTTVYYVPADRSDDWIVDETAPREVVQLIGDGAEAFLASVRAGGETRSDEIVVCPGGIQSGAPIDSFRDLYDTLPRDPQHLLAWAQSHSQGYEAKTLMDLVWLDLPPADLRSAAYRALALLPGFAVAGSDGDLTTLERSDDIGGGETLVSTLVIDTDSGQMRSYTSSILQASGDGIAPAGVPDMRMTFRSTVVDSAP